MMFHLKFLLVSAKEGKRVREGECVMGSLTFMRPKGKMKVISETP